LAEYGLGSAECVVFELARLLVDVEEQLRRRGGAPAQRRIVGAEHNVANRKLRIERNRRVRQEGVRLKAAADAELSKWSA
jgi:hypothetical protein